MKARDLIFLAVGGCVAFFGLLILYAVATSVERPPSQVPSIGGQKVPAEHLSLEFTNRFNIYSNSRATNLVFNDCRIIGFTGESGETGRGLSPRYGFFTRWIVLERQDGRRVYLPAQSIEYIEDADHVAH
jgi:hypothetical protein